MGVRVPDGVLYFDLGSPYAYLALERAETVLGRRPGLEPILLGAIFGWRGHGSWADGPARERNIAELETRARRYGLPAIVWPPGWPVNGLTAMRAATWAKARGREWEFARAVFRIEFTGGADISELGVLAACADEAGLDGRELAAAVASPAVKESLRVATETAWAAGVRGVPSLRVGDVVFYGDDRLEEAAALGRPAPRSRDG